MPYRQMAGDYYRGDYYQGGIGSFLSRIGQVAASFIPGGTVATGIIKSVGTGIMPAASRSISLTGRAGVLAREAAGALGRHPVATGLAAAGMAGLAGAGAERLIAGPGAAGVMRGFHMSKPHRIYGKYPLPPHLVKNRRMRVTNPRALHRAIRRAAGFARMARRVMRFTSPRPPRGRAWFPAKRRSARRLKA